MFRNYLKIAFRNLWKHKIFSFINITGLAIGMAVCILILLWVRDELNFDKFQENSSQLYRVIQEADYAGHDIRMARTPFPLGPALKNDFPEISDAARVFVNGMQVKVGEKTFEDDEMIFADPSFLKMFSFPLLQGDAATALSNPLSIILSEETAQKYFGTRDALGKTLMVMNKLQVQVTGIIKNTPRNSHLQFDFIVPMNILKEFGFDIDQMPWTNSNNSLYTYVMLQKNAGMHDVDQKISNIMGKHVSTSANRMFLQPFSQIHLHSNFLGDVEGQGDIKYVYIFSIMAVFVLLIACINFMNLTTARSGNRAKEVGMRKVIGASRKDIVKQFFGESVFMSLIALGFAIVLVELLLPVFNHLSNKELAVDYLGNSGMLLGLIGIALLTGLVAGSYPALFLSSFQPVKVLKGSLRSGAKSSLFRKVLVITQFSLSIILIIATTVVYSQINYMSKKNLGFDKEQLVYIHLNRAAREKCEPLKNELLKNPNVVNVTVASHLLTDVTHAFDHVSWEGKNPDENVTMNGISVDYDFIKTLGMQLAAGRDFSEEHTTDATQA
ncbi:MAG: ABC transporter permease, partial [Calditrichia bacterium]